MKNLILLIALFLFSILNYGCTNYDAYIIKTQSWEKLDKKSMRDVGIGYFQSQGNAKNPLTESNFYDSLSFALREQGYITKEAQHIHKILKANQITQTKIIDSNEILQLTREFSGRLYLQGKIEEKRTETLLEDLYQISITIWIYDTRSGEKIGEIKVFAHDMEYFANPQILDLARLSVDKLNQLIAE